jgi:hypothetical protein
MDKKRHEDTKIQRPLRRGRDENELSGECPGLFFLLIPQPTEKSAYYKSHPFD